MTSLRNGNDLASSTLPVLRALDDTREIEHLYRSTVILDLSRDGRQSGKLVSRSYSRLVMTTWQAAPHTIPSECCPVNLLIRVDFPTEGNPMNPTLATPVRATSKPASSCQQVPKSPRLVCLQPPPPPLEVGVRSSRLSFASFAFSCPSLS